MRCFTRPRRDANATGDPAQPVVRVVPVSGGNGPAIYTFEVRLTVSCTGRELAICGHGMRFGTPRAAHRCGRRWLRTARGRRVTRREVAGVAPDALMEVPL